MERPDGRQALVDTDFLPTVAKDDSVFIITDRPVFKPGETFFYKGTIRAFEDGRLTVPRFDDTRAEVSLIPFNGPPTDLQATVPLSSFGSFSGSLSLDADQPPGLYRLIARIGEKPYGGEFRVRDYVKPTFYLELVDRSPTVHPGGHFFVKFRAKRYSGGVPANVKYEVFLYRKKFEAPQWVVESGGGLNAGANYQGEIKSATALTEPKRIYSSVESRLAEGKIPPTNTWDSAPMLEASGETSYEFDLPKITASPDEEWIYTIMVRAVDASGSQALLTDTLYMTLSEAQVSVGFSKSVARVGEKGLKVLIHSTTPDGRPAPRSGGTVDVLLEHVGAQAATFVKLPFLTDDRGQCALDLPDMAQAGRLRALAVLETHDGTRMEKPGKSQPAMMIVGGGQGEAVLDNREVQLYTRSTLLSPGEKAQVLALLPMSWGTSEQGVVWETVSGRKIYETRSSVIKGRSRWFEVEARPEFGTGFYHTISVPLGDGKYAEQTLGFRIIPLAKRLDIAILPEREQTEPLKPFTVNFEVKNAKGEPVPDTELAVTIVDRAVYAVQQEFRPGIFDFFYPLPRLNLATFYSDELQGYGYADILKKPNFRLGALKSQSRISKKSMRDTAGWYPHVVTDASGRASITVDLPGNVTEWLITAVAADKEGRVGEGTEKFRTVTDISLDMVAPQFLRRGEEVEITVRSTNHLPDPLTVTSSLELSGSGVLKAGGQNNDYTLEKQAEHLWPLRLQATAETGTATLRVHLDTREKVHVGGTEEFDIPLKPSALRQVFSSVQQGNSLVTNIPDTAHITSLKVQVNTGLLGAALNAASALVSYPYGCTEQLVHTTVPNLVLMDLVRRAGIDREQLGSLAEILIKAEKHAGLGVKKILQNQKSNGGFSLWPSDPEASREITLITLSALKLAKDLKIPGAESGFDRAGEWLSEQMQKEEQAQAQVPEKGARSFSTLDGFRLSLLAQTGWYGQPWQQEIAYVEAIGKQETPSLLDLVYALKIFAAQKDQSWNRFNESLKKTTLKEAMIEKLKKAGDQLGEDGKAKTGGNPNAWFSDALGFGFGPSYLISSVLGVLDDLGALPPALETKLKGTLIAGMKNGYWTSTFDSAQVIFNTRGILTREATAAAQEKASGARRILLRKKDGAELGVLTRIPAGFVGRFDDPGAPDLLSRIQIDNLTANEFAFAAITADVPYPSVASKSDGVTLERRLYRVTATGREVLDPARPLHQGDAVVSEVEVRRGTGQGDRSGQSRFLVVEDGVPSLARTIDEDKTFLADAGLQADTEGYWARVKQTLRYPDKTIRIVEVPPGEGIHLYQVWQVGFSGTASIPPASAFDMYDESIQGNTAAQDLHVEATMPAR